MTRRDGDPGGLTSDEAARRRARWGPNELTPPRRLEAAREVLRYLVNPLVLVLLLASTVSAALGQLVSSVVIAMMIVLSLALNIGQSYRSQQAARRLRERVGHTATVLRDGALREIPVSAIVPGDVVHLAAGDLVPADARLIEAKDLFLNEAPLTGESLPREKQVRPEARDEAGDPAGGVFRGTSVVSGLGTAVVVQTGPATEFGRVVARLAARPRPSSSEAPATSAF